MLPSKIDQMKASHETGSEANFGFGRALMPSCLEMCPPEAAFFSFRMQPQSQARSDNDLQVMVIQPERKQSERRRETHQAQHRAHNHTHTFVPEKNE